MLYYNSLISDGDELFQVNFSFYLPFITGCFVIDAGIYKFNVICIETRRFYYFVLIVLMLATAGFFGLYVKHCDLHTICLMDTNDSLIQLSLAWKWPRDSRTHMSTSSSPCDHVTNFFFSVCESFAAVCFS